MEGMSLLPSSPTMQNTRSVRGGFALAALAALALVVAVVNLSHMSSRSALVSDDFAWQRGYSWYPDKPGQYPAGKTSWYYNSGGLYDQAHVPGYTTTAAYNKAPVGSLLTVSAPDGEEFALVPVNEGLLQENREFARLEAEEQTTKGEQSEVWRVGPGAEAERQGPEFLSSNPQMQILTCFGHCGADCQKYCKENYAKCSQNDGTVGIPGIGSTYLEPGPDYYAPTGRGHGGPDHVNWCQTNFDRCRGHCQ